MRGTLGGDYSIRQGSPDEEDTLGRNSIRDSSKYEDSRVEVLWKVLPSSRENSISKLYYWTGRTSETLSRQLTNESQRTQVRHHF